MSAHGPDDAADPVDRLVEVLTLTDTEARTGEDIFTGPSQWMPHGRVYGGQVLAQSLMAAIRTVPDDRAVHSMHGYFLRPGDTELPITFSVDRIHDGRSFSTRRTQAYQHGKPILSMIASFQDADPGVDHQVPMPSGIPDPEALPSAAEVLASIDNPAAVYWGERRPFDLRHVTPPIYIDADEERSTSQAIWMRARGPLPDDPNLHRAALAYASDYVIIEPVLRRHGLIWARRDLSIASLDHAMWWHRDARADEWLLYTQESPSARGGRGLGMGRIYDRAGNLVASIAQEGMVRVRDLSDT